MKKLLSLAVLSMMVGGCGYANLDEVKEGAASRWKQVGYEVIGYEGFQWGAWYGGCYGGARVWHSLRRIPDNGIIYTGYLKSWCGEPFQVYGPQAIDAIKPNNR